MNPLLFNRQRNKVNNTTVDMGKYNKREGIFLKAVI